MSHAINVAVIYYSSTGNVHALANGAAEGAEKEGAEVRLRRVAELAPAEVVAAKPEWAGHADATRHIPEAGVNDLIWADVVLFGTPTRYGAMASQLKQFIDTTGPIWEKGLLADKVYSAFTSTYTNHGGQESTLLSLYNVIYHWGGVIVPPGYTDPVQFELGNPYGTAHISGGGAPAEVHLRTVRYQAARATAMARALKQGRN
ncbi:NAD(P)H:quinone oxidoreductase [Phytoactinopolyspora alkaliphila]|uniref:NAD(P)H:quinone oxidoreductase n=1 Tax=Phytoactinopolyspora alkaliphila TaxID=1783498 RepID=A0A6N9YL49_9ACTN|nr:NAD(P)H:quinone oxidoreductase [Phytoactinopolyspora alkaliphila]NED95766.1 NAD(P)H:quinone oxidoreductase [Phytoactinopolyspora alkaliphila]